MAYTKIHAIKRTLSKALDYIENPDKTDYQQLVSGYNVDPLTASIDFEMTTALAGEFNGYTKRKNNNLAYHMIQSFSPDDHVTPEQAHEIGKKLADTLLDGKYEYVISTHIDKGHTHNHIIFNATSFYDQKKFNSQPYKTASKIRSISDNLCAEQGLSVIHTNQQLKSSYQRNRKFSSRSSYKSEIRKKLNFILDISTSFEQFTAFSKELGITIDNNKEVLRYKLPDQVRFTGADQLSDDDTFQKSNILDRVYDNARNQSLIKDAIKDAAKEAVNFNIFQSILKDRYSILCKEAPSGIVSYKLINGVSDPVKDFALGSSYSGKSIKNAIQTRIFDFDISDADVSIRQRFESLFPSNTPDKETTVILTAKNIKKITKDGIQINLPDASGNNKLIYIDSNHVDYRSNTNDYVVHIGSSFDYYPSGYQDTDSDEKPLKGEEVIRTLELVNGVLPYELEVSPKDIKSISPKGITLSLPDAGLDRVFIENKYVTYSNLSSGSCRVQLYYNWNYKYNSTSNNKKIFSSVKGHKLWEHLTSHPLEIDQSLSNKIEFMKSKASLSQTKQLANYLLFMKTENISSEKDFDSKLLSLQEQLSTASNSIKTLRDKSAVYKNAAKYLIAYNQYLPIKQAADRQLPFAKNKFLRDNESELKSFDFAAAQLEKLGVNTNVDPDKVKELIINQDHQIQDLSNSVKEITDKITTIKDIQNLSQEITTRYQPNNSTHKIADLQKHEER